MGEGRYRLCRLRLDVQAEHVMVVLLHVRVFRKLLKKNRRGTWVIR
jgi:hypothetical protein